MIRREAEVKKYLKENLEQIVNSSECGLGNLTGTGIYLMFYISCFTYFLYLFYMLVYVQMFEHEYYYYLHHDINTLLSQVFVFQVHFQ